MEKNTTGPWMSVLPPITRSRFLDLIGLTIEVTVVDCLRQDSICFCLMDGTEQRQGWPRKVYYRAAS